jgi:predicted phosphohydrolase
MQQNAREDKVMQVYLRLNRHWADVISENDVFILAKDIDGVMTYVVRDGLEQVRVK